MDFNSPFWALAMGCSPLALPPALRYSCFDEIINATANAEKTQPEFILHTPKDTALEARRSRPLPPSSSADDTA